MDNPIIIEAKKRVFIEAVKDTCDILHLPMPEIDFSGKDDPGGNQLAHCHPKLYKICISERQLKLQNATGLKETANHEMTHLIGLIEHGHKFEKVKTELMSRGWRPARGSGVQFISGDEINERSRRIRNDPKALAEVNEDSDLIKFLENKNEHNETRSSKQKLVNARNSGSKNKQNPKKYSGMTKAEIEESRKKIGIIQENVSSNSALHETGICQKNGCNRKAVAKCKYCNKAFCEEHIEPVLVISAQEIWNLNTIRESDPEKYEKYTQDWNRSDGHPCSAYTDIWNEQHNKELINSQKIIKFPPKEHQYTPQISIHGSTKTRKIRQLVGLVMIFIAIVILALSYNAYLTSYHKTISTSNFTFLFSGIFWDLVGILMGAVLIAIGLILAYPKGARWLARRGK